VGGWTLAWTNAALAIGAWAVAAPFIVHMMTRRTPRTLVFPTLQFLKRAHASQSRLFRMRDIILLIVRTAFITLLLLAFLKPVLRARAMTDAGQQQQAAIIVVDSSLSMQYNAGGVTPYARAQRVVSDLLDHIPSSAATNVIFASASAKPSLATPGSSAAPLLRDVQASAPTLERGDIGAAIDEAVNQLDAFPNHARTIYLVSDFQRTNWAAAPFGAIPDDVKLVFSPVGEASASNAAITNVMLRPRSPVVSEMIEIVCSVANYGPSAIDITVTLEMDRIGEVPAQTPESVDTLQRQIRLAPASSGSVSFRLRATDTGSFEGHLRIPDDNLSADNDRFFVFDVQNQIDVLLVSDATREAQSSGYFVLRALDPFALDTGTPHASTVRARECRARDLDLPSAQPQVLVLDGAGPLPTRSAEQIAAYLADGGAMVYFLSDVLDKSNLDAIASASKTTFSLPFTLTSMINHRALGSESASWTNANFEEPVLRRFRDGRDVANLLFYQYFGTERVQGRGQVFARYGDGNFALGKGALGAGSILLCNFSAARDASDIATRPAFIPLIHEMIKSMRPQEGAVSRAIAGEAASGSVPASASATGVQFFAPSGKTVSANTDRRGERLSVILSEVDEQGFYRVMEGSHHLGSLPVNVDARESDLLALSNHELEQLAASPKRKMAAASGRDAIEALMDGVPIWPYLLLGAMCVLGCEQALLLMLKK